MSAGSQPADGTGLEWRRVHPVTALVRGWTVFAALAVVVAQQSSDDLLAGRGLGVPAHFGTILLGLAAVAVLGLGWSAVSWRCTTYAIDDDSVHLRTGVLFRQQRKARLDRLQAVDVVQPLVARLVGLAELRLEVAGGGDSAIRLGLLRVGETDALRNELLARAAGVRAARAAAAVPAVPPAAAVPGVPPAAAAPERPLLEVSPGRLIWSLVRSGAFVLFVLGALALAAVTAGTRQTVLLVSLLPAMLGILGYAFSRFSREFGFRSAISPDGIRLRHGLLESRAQTIPPGRVQAVRLTQPLLWRDRDWWRVEVNVAGYGRGGQDGESSSVLLPVGSREDAVRTVWLVLPDLGTPDPVDLLDEALAGSGAGPHGRFTVSPRAARWLDPWAWSRDGFAVTGRALLLRGGRLVRRLVLVPHERTQSVGLEQGPLQRRLGLASVLVHSTPGPVAPQVPHLRAADAAALVDAQAARAREARAHDVPERWMAPGPRPTPEDPT
ncbi:PH domain-containing protein [Cellulomonas sp. PhB143]|uniref:PH domain-containing protein n=1 Tax=Cellulomonas sp. PhB143 TaxID=2485186 RepID=UPI000F46B595|nr:PH domain-containing protein [Cellulomonas sp. PhB143]ROS78820.1 putative membrane protein [Cellulomonas sp. PhB143]